MLELSPNDLIVLTYQDLILFYFFSLLLPLLLPPPLQVATNYHFFLIPKKNSKNLYKLHFLSSHFTF